MLIGPPWGRCRRDYAEKAPVCLSHFQFLVEIPSFMTADAQQSKVYSKNFIVKALVSVLCSVSLAIWS